MVVHGLAGGTGSTTVAVNLAWERANVDKKNPPSVCLLDLDLQYGSVATFLDLPRRDAVFEVLSSLPDATRRRQGGRILLHPLCDTCWNKCFSHLFKQRKVTGTSLTQKKSAGFASGGLR